MLDQRRELLVTQEGIRCRCHCAGGRQFHVEVSVCESLYKGIPFPASCGAGRDEVYFQTNDGCLSQLLCSTYRVRPSSQSELPTSKNLRQCQRHHPLSAASNWHIEDTSVFENLWNQSSPYSGRAYCLLVSEAQVVTKTSTVGGTAPEHQGSPNAAP